MPKKNCCCNVCEWCNHDHYQNDFYVGGDPINGSGNLLQDTQPNWKTLGTLTTELPSIGHPMTRIYLDNCSTTDIFACCDIAPPPPVGTVISEDSKNCPATYTSTLRTSYDKVDVTSKGWGTAIYYGDICPSWFNGINMTNIKNDEDVFFNFTFELKIEKISGSDATTIVNIKRTGPGKNVHPHPDACHSFNVNDSILWGLASGCGVFFRQYDDYGNPKPCSRDFARMPRGPWPYRFKPHYGPDKNDITHCANDITFYSKEDIIKTKANPELYIGTPATNGGTIGSNILKCNLVPSTCGLPQPCEATCCPSDSYTYLNPKEYCDRLDPDHGTPFGWEDCPSTCISYSNSVINSGSVDLDNLRFFGWWNPVNRYTTPEWDLYEGVYGSTSGISGGTAGAISKKLSLNVIVPTAFEDFCYPDSVGGIGFGEWSFGMDYEANDEIVALENAGYVWSDGVEQDGVWINKTPTNALRVLFTLDHSDLDQGKVWRVFRDWDVTVTNLVKTFNAGTPQETKFRISIKQKVKEVQFSSMGCDCPSGYKIDDNGKIIPNEPACEPHINEFGYEAPFGNCWMSNIDGPNSKYIGGRVSFCERGPIALKMKVETDETGCQMCNETRVGNGQYENCTDKFGSVTRSGNSNEETGGQILIVNGPNTDVRNTVRFEDVGPFPDPYQNGGVNCLCYAFQTSAVLPTSTTKPAIIADTNGNPILPNAFITNFYKEHGARYNYATADLPYQYGDPKGGVRGYRYRSTYNAVQMAESPIENEFGYGLYGFYRHLYGDLHCVWDGGSDCPGQYDRRYIYRTASVYIDRHPTQSPVGYCEISCPCGAQGSNNSGSGNGGESGDPCYGWTGPGPCPYYGGFSGGTGGFEDCPCGPNSSRLYPSYGCRSNIVKEYNPGDDIFQRCSPPQEHGSIQSFCYSDEYVMPLFGLDSERIYFSANGQVSTLTGLGDLNCAKSCMCPGNQNQNSSCWWTDQYGVKRCNFCKGVGDSIGFGFMRNTFINWKKYLCRKRYHENYKIPVDIMGNLSWNCNAVGEVLDPFNGGSTSAQPCDHAWSSQNCETPNIDLESYSYSKQRIQSTSNLSPKYRVNISKYNIAENDTDWCGWDTTYKPNPARSGLSGGRNHIIINAQGPI